jgi:hypothetical protein
MIKFTTIGGLNKAINNPTLTFASDVEDYSFQTVDGKLYLIDAQVEGDKKYYEGFVIKAGEKARGFYVPSFAGCQLDVDETHIAYGVGESYASITAGTTILTVNSSGKLAIAESAPESGVYFKVTDKVALTGKAVRVDVYVVDATATE